MYFGSIKWLWFTLSGSFCTLHWFTSCWYALTVSFLIEFKLLGIYCIEGTIPIITTWTHWENVLVVLLQNFVESPGNYQSFTNMYQIILTNAIDLSVNAIDLSANIIDIATCHLKAHMILLDTLARSFHSVRLFKRERKYLSIDFVEKGWMEREQSSI